MNPTKALVTALFLALAPAAGASSHDSSQAAGKDMTEGEVRKVDLDARKVTIRHGPITNLDMPAMTMVFRVKDPALLAGLKSGAKIRFSAEKVGGAYTVTRMEEVK